MLAVVGLLLGAGRLAVGGRLDWLLAKIQPLHKIQKDSKPMLLSAYLYSLRRAAF